MPVPKQEGPEQGPKLSRSERRKAREAEEAGSAMPAPKLLPQKALGTPGYCFGFQTNECKRGDQCKFKHEKDDTFKPAPKSKGQGKQKRVASPAQKDTSKIPCTFPSKGRVGQERIVYSYTQQWHLSLVQQKVRALQSSLLQQQGSSRAAQRSSQRAH